jgi:hypothetical protein
MARCATDEAPLAGRRSSSVEAVVCRAMESDAKISIYRNAAFRAARLKRVCG